FGTSQTWPLRPLYACPYRRTRRQSLRGQVLGTGFGCRRSTQASRGASSSLARIERLAGKARCRARFRTRTVAARSLHGKEGVSGSSPEEGLKELQISYFCCLV